MERRVSRQEIDHAIQAIGLHPLVEPCCILDNNLLVTRTLLRRTEEDSARVSVSLLPANSDTGPHTSFSSLYTTSVLGPSSVSLRAFSSFFPGLLYFTV